MRASLSSALAVALVLQAAPLALHAQVGHLPDKSPYEDVKLGQTISLSGGWLATGKDPAGVAPKSSAFGQLRYDAAVGGPTFLYARYTFAPSSRTQLAPGAIKSKRVVGTPSVPTSIVDGGIDIALTGRKTWHHVIPSLMGGIGVVTDFAKADSGAYQFGGKFSFTYGLGMRYVRRNGTQLRFDVSNYVWQYQYPDLYFTQAADSTSVLTDTKNRSKWKSNWALTAGFSLPIFR